MASLGDLQTMDPGEFELLVVGLLGRMGLTVEHTGRTGDGGVDVIACSPAPILGGQYVVQCKRFTGNVGEPALRDLYGVVHHRRASKGILITTSDFTSQAIVFAKDKPLELINGEQLLRMLESAEGDRPWSYRDNASQNLQPSLVRKACKLLSRPIVSLKRVLLNPTSNALGLHPDLASITLPTASEIEKRGSEFSALIEKISTLESMMRFGSMETVEVQAEIVAGHIDEISRGVGQAIEWSIVRQSSLRESMRDYASAEPNPVPRDDTEGQPLPDCLSDWAVRARNIIEEIEARRLAAIEFWYEALKVAPSVPSTVNGHASLADALVLARVGIDANIEKYRRLFRRKERILQVEADEAAKAALRSAGGGRASPWTQLMAVVLVAASLLVIPAVFSIAWSIGEVLRRGW